MQVFGITGPGSEELADRLVDRLAGRVGVVRAGASSDGGVVADAAGRTAGAATVHDLSGDGWSATGTDDESLDAVVDRLGVDHEYGIVLDAPDARLPRVVLGDSGSEVSDREGVLATPPSPDEAALDDIVAAVEDLEPHETLASLVARIKRSPRADRAGAIATFTGRVRARDDEEDEPTEFLEFEKYEGIAEERMAAIETELAERDGVQEVLLHHRTGVVEAGEDIVFVVVLAGHRSEAFRTVEDGIDRLKDEVPLFKKEVTTDETFWVHDRE
jgi:molybdopterin synthase catalytic subunit